MTPDEYTIQETSLEVGDGHSLYVYDWGNKSAQTAIIYLHGGPGSRVKDRAKGFFDPQRQRVIFFDQRGCGKSLPYGSLENNTTDRLVADISTVADHLKLNKFILVGGSWGSCLALAYALKHPDRVEAMVLHGIFTGSKAETEWLNNGMFKTFLPDVWERYLQATPAEYRDDPSAYHIKNILGDNPEIAKLSGLTYGSLEGAACRLDDRFTPYPIEDFDIAGIKIETHYLANACFMPDRYIPDNAHTLSMPLWIVQGRYDMVCPPHTAYALNHAVPHSELIWTTSGHAPERETWNVIRTILLQLTKN